MTTYSEIRTSCGKSSSPITSDLVRIRAFDRILEFAHISRPVVVHKNAMASGDILLGWACFERNRV